MARTEGEEREPPSEPGGDDELSRKEFALLLTRDIAIAAILVAAIFGVMFAYTQVWPPVVVVESESMQHSDTRSALGVIDTGDLVLVQAVSSKNDVVTWVEGHATGYETYGDFGDVIIFRRPRGAAGEPPIIHRPILYLVYNATSSSYDAPSLLGIDRTWWTATNRTGALLGSPFNITGTIAMNHLGFRGDRTHSIPVSSLLGSNYKTDGYVTMGDNNAYKSGFDGWLVAQTLVIGRARGELPWFGLIKLTVSPTASGCCHVGWGDPDAPRNSWDSLATSLVMIPVGIFLADYGFVYAERIWRGRRRRKRPAGEEEETAESGPEPEPGGPR
jgi:signal peptidase